MTELHHYRIHLEGTGNKTGHLTAPADELAGLPVASPPEFGGPGRTWSPEHLFVAALSSCLMTTFRAIASGSLLEVVSYEDEATGELVRATDGMYRIETVVLRPQVVIADPTKLERAHRLLEKAERACLISRSVSCTVTMEPRIVAVTATPV
jgi:peroxiredoxin-like protein